LRAIAQRPEQDKLARLLAQAARFEAGQVHLPESAPWLATYLNELLGFPNSTHDDQVDATLLAASPSDDLSLFICFCCLITRAIDASNAGCPEGCVAQASTEGSGTLRRTLRGGQVVYDSLSFSFSLHFSLL
jgi:hypothetical protein